MPETNAISYVKYTSEMFLSGQHWLVCLSSELRWIEGREGLVHQHNEKEGGGEA